jgi:hypothetical protein
LANTYNANGRKAGTYTRRDHRYSDNWTKQ